MVIKTRRYLSTRFTLYFSHANCAYMFNRHDTGHDTELTILSGYSEQDAIKYYQDKLDFFCEVCGIDADQLSY